MLNIAPFIALWCKHKEWLAKHLGVCILVFTGEVRQGVLPPKVFNREMSQCGEHEVPVCLYLTYVVDGAGQRSPHFQWMCQAGFPRRCILHFLKGNV